MLPFLVTTGSPHFWSATGLAKGYEDASYLLCIDCTFVMRSDIVSGCFRLVGWVAGWLGGFILTCECLVGVPAGVACYDHLLSDMLQIPLRVAYVKVNARGVVVCIPQQVSNSQIYKLCLTPAPETTQQ